MGVPRTLAKGLSKLKEAAELRKLGGTQAERMARAAEQGYGIDFLHGSPTLKETGHIDLDHPSRTDSGYLGKAFYGTDPTLPYIAESYTLPMGYGPRGDVLNLKTRAKNFKDFTYDENYKKTIADFGQQIGVKSEPYSPEWAAEFSEKMQENGYEGARGLADDGTPIEYAIYNPAQIRSVNADFNPEYRESSNLLAGIAGVMPYAGATAAALAGATGSQDAEAGPLQSLGRAAPYLATGALGAAMMTPQDTQAYNDYIRDEMEARTAADKFAQMRGSKAGYWEARRQELLDMVNGLGEMANNVVLPALDKPLQGYLGLAGTLGTLASGGGFEQAIQAGARNATQPIDQTTYGYGGAVTDALSPYTTPEAAAAAGALVHGGIQIASPF